MEDIAHELTIASDGGITLQLEIGPRLHYTPLGMSVQAFTRGADGGTVSPHHTHTHTPLRISVQPFNRAVLVPGKL